MKKLLVSMLAFFSITAFSQTSAWILTAVPGGEVGTVGYIYHTNAVGTQGSEKTTKVISGIRLVCTVDGFTANQYSDPIIAIFWQGMHGSIPQYVNIKIDGREVGLGNNTKWDQDGPLLLRTVAESAILLQSMKTGNSISFQWTGNDSIQRRTIFDLRNFKTHLAEFNRVCKTEI